MIDRDRDPATWPDLNLREHPQDPLARQPDETIAEWLRRVCALSQRAGTNTLSPPSLP